MRKKHPSSTHYCEGAKLTRIGVTILRGDEFVCKCASIRKARRYMRTGKEQRS